MVYDTISSLSKLIKIDRYTIDNNIFRLHYKPTVAFLIALSLLVTANQYFGDPIDCIEIEGIDTKLLDTFCWIHTTFTLPNALNKTVGVEVPHPGIDNFTPGEKRVYHKYYQWVCFVLFFQAVMFYLPRYLWKMWEAGRVRSLVLQLDAPILEKKTRDEEMQLLLEYFKSNQRHHNWYFFHFVLCEVLNFINVIIQMHMVDSFLGGAFSTFGIDVLRYTEMDQEHRADPMVAVFPRMTKCVFHYFGPSGDLQKKDTLCILPLNIVNEKIYVFLWFWFVFLAMIGGAMLAYRLLILLSEDLRKMIIRSKAYRCDAFHLNVVLNVSKIGDWFLLYLLAKNMYAHNFCDFIERYSEYILKSQSIMNLDEKHPIMTHDDSKK